MPHKFKVGDGRSVSAPLRGAYTITRALPGTAGEPEYRIRRADEEHERVARESELSEA
jgi:hypothetical protein